MNTKTLLIIVACVLLLPAAAFADLRVATIFQDNMVLQRELKNPVWGWTDAGASVTVSFAGQEKTAKANDKGYWIVELDPLAASSDGWSLSIKSGAHHIERKNILVGEVWVLSGQSNMARPLRNESFDYPFYKDYYNDAEHPTVRFMAYGMGASDKPLSDVEPPLRKDTPWKILSKSTAPEVMSIGFFFAKRLTAELKVPVGLVQVAVPGTPQTAWMAKETLESLPGENGKANYYQSLFAAAEARMTGAKSGNKTWADYEAALEKWRKDPGATERSWPGDSVVTDFPSSLYNTRVYPLAPLAFRGMLWHQGEAGPGGTYGKRMVAMIKQHRELFKNDFYFIYGTLTRKTQVSPPLEPQTTNHGNIDQSMIEGDFLFGKQGKAALVNFFDLGNTATHWARKEEAGRRMALAALDRVYGQKHLFTGPELLEGKIAGGTVTCKFRYTGDGIKFEPSIDNISGVIIVDKKGKAFWGDVKVTAPDTIVISHPKVTDAGAVYYGFHTNPHETLFNSEDFPAFAFSVGQAAAPRGKDSSPIVAITSGGSAKIELNISQVRREGYNFAVVESKTPAGAHVGVRAYIPASWKGLEVWVGDKAGTLGKPTTENGRKYIELDAIVNGPQITIAEQGHAEALRKVRRP